MRRVVLRTVHAARVLDRCDSLTHLHLTHTAPSPASHAHARARARSPRRLLNLELAQAHGAKAWRWYISNLEAEAARRKVELKTSQEAVDDVNKKRKVEQAAVGPKLHGLRCEWWALADKTAQIETGCALLEHASKRLRGEE